MEKATPPTLLTGTAIKAFEAAKASIAAVIVERFITGYDFRCLVINNKFICAALRTPASVVGDGVHNIQWLIERNEQDRKVYGHEKYWHKSPLISSTQRCSMMPASHLEHVPKKGEKSIAGNLRRIFPQVVRQRM